MERLMSERGAVLAKMYEKYLKNMGPSTEPWPSPAQVASFDNFKVSVTIPNIELYSSAMSPE